MIKSSDKRLSISDQLFSLKDENVELKKQLSSKDDRTKLMVVKIEKLSKELAKERRSGRTTDKPPPTSSSVREEKESEDLIHELRKQIQTLTHQNTSMRGKVHFFKTLHEAETRKRTPYSHIPPRIESGNKRRQLLSGSSQKIRIDNFESNDQLNAPGNETLNDMQELVNHLRLKLIETERLVEQSKADEGKHQNIIDEAQKKHDVEILALQHEVNALKKKIIEQRSSYDDLDEAHKNLTQAHKDIISTTKVLGSDLENERKISSDLRNLLKNEQMKNEAREELQIFIDDLQREKKMLEEELQKMLDNKFTTSRDDEFQLQVSTLKARVAELQNQNAAYLNEKLALHKQIEALKDDLNDMTRRKEVSDRDLYEVQEQLELLRRRFKVYENLNSDDLQEGLALLKLKREAGVTLEFLSSLGSVAEDKKKVQDLRRDYALCAQDLDKTTKLLNLQQQINQELKNEISQLTKKMKLMQNEYEFRLEEYSRLADVRGHKIESLLRELSQTTQGPRADRIVNPDCRLNLLPGQNMLSIHLQGALISPEGCNYLLKHKILSTQEKNFTTCVVIDFEAFETEVSSIGFGTKPVYDFTSNYLITVDDFFINYIQKNSIPLTLYHTNGMDFHKIGCCLANFLEVITKESNSFHYISDIITDDKFVLGQLEYQINIELFMPLAIRAYQERQIALNLLENAKNNIKSENNDKLRVTSKASATNNLKINIGKMKIEPIVRKDNPSIYATIHWEGLWSDILLPSRTSYIADFSFERNVPLQMNSDLDRQLRSGKLVVVFTDDEEDVVYGYAKVPLFNLAIGYKVQDSFSIQDSFGIQSGTIDVEICWEQEYQVQAPSSVPKVISLFDDEKVKRELTRDAVSQEKPPAKVDQPKPAEKVEQPKPAEKKDLDQSVKKIADTDPASEPVSSIRESDISLGEIRLSASSVSDILSGVTTPRDSVTVRDATVSIAPTQATYDLNGADFEIIISSLRINLNDESVRAVFADTKQFFCGFDFLPGVDAEDLESNSIAFNQTGTFKVDLKTKFSRTLINEASNSEWLRNLLGSRGNVTFNVVQEPSEDDALMSDCVDLGMAKLCLVDVLDSHTSDSTTIQEIPVWSLNHSTLLGVLEVEMRGLSAVRYFK